MFKNLGKDLVKAFNTGVSYFLPAVVIGGVFLAFALATGEAGSDGMKVTNGFMQNINTIGSAGSAPKHTVASVDIAMAIINNTAITSSTAFIILTSLVLILCMSSSLAL